MATLNHIDYSAEVHFAQRLAANEKKIRDRAVKRLRKWIAARSKLNKYAFDETDLLKIWKGLFYCMWMSDKPLIQEELAETISHLIHAFQSPQSALLFIDTFFQTMTREWAGIDRLRMDKFYLLVRKCLIHSFELIKKSQWDIELIQKLMDIFKAGVLNAEKEIPDGLRYHLIEIYLDELINVGGSQLSQEETLKMIDPFCQLAVKTSKYTVLRIVVNEIFKNGIIVVSNVGRDDGDENEGQDKDGDENEGHDKDEDENGRQDKDEDDDVIKKEDRNLKFDYAAIADHLFNLVSADDVSSRNRKILYDIVQRLRDLTDGRYPVESVDLKLHNAIEHMHKIFKNKKKERRKRWRENVKGRKRKSSDEEWIDGDCSTTTKKVKKMKNEEKKSGNLENQSSTLNVNDKDDVPSEIMTSDTKVSKDTKRKTTKKVNKQKSKKMAEVLEEKEQGVTKEGSSCKENTMTIEKPKTRKSERKEQSITQDMEIVTMKTSESQPFVKFEKVTMPSAFVRKAHQKKIAVSNQLPAENPSSPKKKRVEFALFKNKMQDPHEYKAQVRKSPVVPFDKSKKPTKPVLKQSPAPPVLTRHKNLRRSTRVKAKKKSP
ncbi:ribosomal RNA processing protein 1 homolog A-like [Glandiceps talaboti]